MADPNERWPLQAREARAQDFEALVDIYHSAVSRFGAEYEPHPLGRDMFDQACAKGLARVAVADEGALAGYSLVVDRGQDAFLFHLFVPNGWSGRGIGAFLIEDLVAQAKQAGKRAVTLLTSGSAPWNAPFYRKNGFVQLGAQMPDYLAQRLEENRAYFAPIGLKSPLILLRVAMERLVTA